MNKRSFAALAILAFLHSGVAHAVTDDPRLDRLVRDLGDDSYPVRQKATRALEKMKDVPESALHRALENLGSLEAKTRLQFLLQQRDRLHPEYGIFAAAMADPDSARMAQRMVKAMGIIEKNHTTPCTRGQLTAWAIEGMYHAVNQPIPSAIKTRLKNLDKASNEDLQGILCHVCYLLKAQPEMKDDKDLDACFRGIFARLEPTAATTDGSRYYRPEEIHRW